MAWFKEEGKERILWCLGAIWTVHKNAKKKGEKRKGGKRTIRSNLILKTLKIFRVNCTKTPFNPPKLLCCCTKTPHNSFYSFGYLIQ